MILTIDKHVYNWGCCKAECVSDNNRDARHMIVRFLFPSL